MRKILLAATAALSLAMMMPETASARGFGGWHGGGGGGWHGGGWRGGVFGRGFALGAVGLGLGLGYGASYAYGPGYGYGYNPYGYAGYYGGGYEDGCYVIRRRVWTPYGWRLRSVNVCG